MKIRNIVRAYIKNIVRDILLEEIPSGITTAMDNQTSLSKEDVKMSRKEAANFLGVSQATLLRWEKSGYLKPAGHINSKTVIYFKSQLIEKNKWRL